MAGQSVANLFLPLPGGTTAVYQAGLNFAWYRHADWLGSSRIASDTNHAIKYDGAYSPYGESYAENNPPVIDRNFTGQNQDLTPAGDLYDFLYREYHAPHGRWISPDPAGLGAVNLANPQSWNRYAYVNSSPLNSVDPLGLTPLCVSGDPCPTRESVLHLRGETGGIYSSLTFAATSGMLSPLITATTTFTFKFSYMDGDVVTMYAGDEFASLGSDKTGVSVTSETTLSYADPASIPTAGPGSTPMPSLGPAATTAQGKVFNYLPPNPVPWIVRSVVKKGLCGGSPSGAIVEGMISGATKFGAIGAVSGFVGGEMAFGTAGVPGMAVGFAAGVELGTAAGSLYGTGMAALCSLAGVYNWSPE